MSNYQQQRPDDDGLVYGEGYSQSRAPSGQGPSDRSFVGDTFRKFKSEYDKYKNPSASTQNYGYTGSSDSNQGYYGQAGPNTGYPQTGTSPYLGGPPTQRPGEKPDLTSKLLGTLHSTIHNIGSDVANLMGPGNRPPGQYSGQAGGQSSYSTSSNVPASPSHPIIRSRFDSFAPERPGNDVKWYVDGCGYFWAVSQALEGARESVWILDWWLSPELYLRRPPSLNEQWRLDRTLQRAAQRGVKVNIIVYKEVTQALTLSSSHTKHELEKLSPNIAVFRHPDHLPDAQTAQSSLISSFQNFKLDAAGASKLGADALKGLYGLNEDLILYWAHHEKLCLIDGRIAFMGGLDLCFGRWDTNQHAIADAHPSNIDDIVFPGQDFNNARVMDFSDVANPFQNKLDRTKSSRMGWSDIALCLQGSCVQDLRHHFIDRWNFIYDEKYSVRKDVRYSRITDRFPHSASGVGQRPQSPPQSSQGYLQPTGTFPPPPGSQPYTQPGWQNTSRPNMPSGTEQHQGQPIGSSGQFATTSNQYLQGNQTQYAQPPSPSFQATQAQSIGAAGTYAASPAQSYQGFPPPPPGPPPQTSASQSYSGYQQPPSPQPQSFAYGQPPSGQSPGPAQAYQHQTYQTSEEQTRGFDDFNPGTENDRTFSGERGLRGRFDQYRVEGRRIGQELSAIGNVVSDGVNQKFNQYQGKYSGGTDHSGRPLNQPPPVMTCQILRSSTKWSNGTPLEQSIQNAYIDVIRNSQHFVYIENQFFITATGDQQKPVKNLIGQAIVERILRAARNGEKYKVFVVIPAVPAFAGDLRDDGSLGTRAIMEFQYFSINRGGHSIMEKIAQAGFNPMDYIRFYNLRSYDRINRDRNMQQAEQQSGVRYEDARKQHDDAVGAGYGPYGERTGVTQSGQAPQYQQYQAAAQKLPGSGRWDSVSECYMLGGADIRSVPWDGPAEAELNAFVSEELYIHSKTLIADDRIVICGSANLNDRSQLGSHDSEIAILIHDSTPLQSSMNGRPWQASRFAASLRRQLFRKHLGLLRPQDIRRPDANYEPVGVPNSYDWGSPEDNIVSDPLGDAFQSLWNTRARTNTQVFRKAFRAVPDDEIHSWAEYKEFYEYFFSNAGAQADTTDKAKLPPRVEYGHVIPADFPGGARELKELLSQVKGTLVEMPLCFLQDEDIAKEGLALNALTEELYT